MEHQELFLSNDNENDLGQLVPLISLDRIKV
jgi:hypothetical protein